METRKLITESFSLNGFEHIDFLIWLAYVVLVVSVSIYMCKNKESKRRTVREYFLANNTMPWWAVGMTIIAVNISAEQLIGMTGTCYKYGISVAAYEIMAAMTLLIIAKIYVPVFFSKKCFTISQVLRLRYNSSVGTAFSIIWILTYIFLTLTSVSWLGSIAIEHMLGLQGCDLMIGGIHVSIRTVIVVMLLAVSGLCSVWGGQNAIAWTDVVHFIFIFVGGLITAYFTLSAVGGTEGTFVDGIDKLYTFFHTSGHAHDMHIHLIMRKSVDAEAFSQLPGVGLLVGGLWITNMCYWGFNQTIIQKDATSENITEARKGLVFAAFLKLAMPIIILVPGICAYYFMQTDNGLMTYGTKIEQSNEAMAWIIANIVPTGIKGLFFATLTAAIVSTLASVSNSTSALFTLDIYKKFINKKATDNQLVKVARLTAAASLTIAVATMHPIIDKMEDGYNFIQEMSSYIYPALMTLMTIGLFWKKATTKAAVIVVIATFPLGIIMKLAYPGMPFFNRIGYTYIFDIVIMCIVSLTDKSAMPSMPMIAEKRHKAANYGYTMASVAIACYLIATISIIGSNMMSYNTMPDNNVFAYLMDIGIESLFIGGTIFLAGAITHLSNAYGHTQAYNALEYHIEDFSTNRRFMWTSCIILALSVITYAIYW